MLAPEKKSVLAKTFFVSSLLASCWHFVSKKKVFKNSLKLLLYMDLSLLTKPLVSPDHFSSIPRPLL